MHDAAARVEEAEHHDDQNGNKENTFSSSLSSSSSSSSSLSPPPQLMKLESNSSGLSDAGNSSKPPGGDDSPLDGHHDTNGDGKQEQSSTEQQEQEQEQDEGAEQSAQTQNPPPVNSKKRKLAELQPGSRSRSSSIRPPSPPWKKFGAEGPTAFIDNGKRRSGRVNVIPLDLQPPSDKRTTRAKHELNVQQATPTKTKPAEPSTKRRDLRRSAVAAKSTPLKSEPVPARTDSVKVDASPKSVKKDPVKKQGPPPPPPPPSQPSQRVKQEQQEETPARKTSSRLRRSTVNDASKDKTPAKSATSAAAAAAAQSPKFTLKLRRAPFAYIPRHPSHIPKEPQHATLEESLAALDRLEKDMERAPKDDQNYQALSRAAAERPEQNPDQVAFKEATTRLRILEAAAPGGPLSAEKSSLYMPDEQAQPPHQYSHSDHLHAHAVYFKLLLDRERRSHMDAAKRLAHACLAKWREKQPQTEEEKEKEENEHFRLIYRQTVRDMSRTWELVSEEANRIRHARWEEEEKLRLQDKFQKTLERSTDMLHARKLDHARFGSELPSLDGSLVDDDDDSSEPDMDDSEDEDSDDDHRMTSDESESDAAVDDDPDANLSPEALRRKYEDALKEVEVDFGSGAEQDDDDGDDNNDDDDDDDENDDDDDDDQSMLDAPAQDAVDYSHVELEEVDDALMDNSDESTNMSDEDMTSDEDEDDEEEDGGSEEEEEEEDIGLLGFLGGKERKLVQEVPLLDDEEPADTGAETEQPIEPPDRPPDDNDNDEDAEEQPQHADTAIHTSVTPDRNMLSADSHGEDRSSQLSPKDDTTVDATEAESTTSLELDDTDKTMRSLEDTPQPTKPMTKVPSLLRGTLREYQHEGLDWLAKLYENRTNGILADEMGLGKTIQTIALLAHLAEEHHIWGPHLIVVPTSVILNWEMEFKKFLPGFKVLSYYGSVEERAQKRKGWSNPDNYNVVITSYQLILKDILSIRVPEWHYMVLDEAHNIKNFQSQRYQAMIRLKTHARLLLTGTPLQNSIAELWSLLTFLTAGQDGQGMGELHEFNEWFSKPVNEIFVDGKGRLSSDAQAIVNKLHTSLRPYILRRLKSHVEQQLPGKYEHTVICRLSKRQRQLYDSFMALSDTKDKLMSGNMISVSQALMSLRKVCNHPDLFEERPIVTSFAMPKPYSRVPRAAVADYEIKELLLRKKMLAEEPHSTLDLDFLSLNLASREGRSSYHVDRARRLRASAVLNNLVQQELRKLPSNDCYKGNSISAALAHQNRVALRQRLLKIQHYAALTSQRTSFLPIYGTSLVERLTIKLDPFRREPPVQRALCAEWYMSTSSLLHSTVRTLDQRASALEPLIQKFGCITPNVVAENLLRAMAAPKSLTSLRLTLAAPADDAVQEVQPDAFHEARVRLSIAFPDKRLLQYDCGKLQQLAVLLRDLRARGSRALIFTQMTSVLDILERFLNIQGYRYLRLDGSTRIEARQEMMDRFNRADSRLDVFILSSRSGGVGMNLTGASAVIFYDLDWNPQMDRQCQDRAHRIGQTRDVHIYKFVSEHTIEVNILRKSNQKRLLDEVVIQEGEFTTDFFNRASEPEIAGAGSDALAGEGEQDDVAGAAVDRVFGSVNVKEGDIGRVLEAVEDTEDVAAMRAQQREVQTDDFDFDRPVSATAGVADKAFGKRGSVVTSGAATPSVVTPADADFGAIAEGGVAPTTDIATAKADAEEDADADEIVTKADGTTSRVLHVDEYMLRTVAWALKDVPYVPPVDKKRARLDKNGRDRSHRPKRIR